MEEVGGSVGERGEAASVLRILQGQMRKLHDYGDLECKLESNCLEIF